jgi:hypothetical protein
MEQKTELAVVVEPEGDLLPVHKVRQQMEQVQMLMKEVMVRDEDYGIIPGTNKPTLLKPGAEKLCVMFRLDPEYETTERYDGEHLTIVSRCILYSIRTGARMGSGMGSCSSKESKYAFRGGARKCPQCGKEAIIKSKFADGGWYCFDRKGGCKAKFKAGDQSIEGQEIGKIANDQLPDQYNTILKMANKRSLIAATLNVTAASAIFTQDLEDMAENHGAVDEKPKAAAPARTAAPVAVAAKPATPAVPAVPALVERTVSGKLTALTFKKAANNSFEYFAMLEDAEGAIHLRTMDKAVADAMKEAKDAGKNVQVHYVVRDIYNDIVRLG